MKLLTQNSKMKKSSNDKLAIYNWTIPAYKALDGTITCPNASKCIQGCYAKQGAYVWSNVQKSHNEKFQLSKTPQFFDAMVAEIETKVNSRANKNKTVLIRIHDAGDFYSLDYTLTWFRIMRHFEGKSVLFYAYTKQVEIFNDLKDNVPTNFRLIYSYGGKQDNLINPEIHRHALVFENESDVPDNYVNASKDDMLALTLNKNVALVYHGTKSYKKTTWNKVV
jgi:hypothetical protein